MVKYHYFETLEQLSALSEEAVKLSCGKSSAKSRADSSELRKNCDRLICELEDALFSDFLPPLERDSIAACAHCLSRITDASLDLWGQCAPGMKQNDEGAVCISLAEELTRSIAKLRHIRKPEELPNSQGFRELLREGRQAHQAMLTKLRQGVLPRSAAEAVIATGRLRGELSRCFDEVVEIMLNNI
ncbi:MAG: hypothetical protein IJY47_07415 [Clostridia bacterium]|nr:hypothetical protein [Clostridia bacterium]